MRIAIVGSGVSGLVAAYHLSDTHEVTVYEAASYAGGHTQTHSVTLAGREYAVDTGFIVFNDWTYPSFIKLLDELGVKDQPSSMSFSVKCERTGLEYNGGTLNGLFAQRRNLVNPSFIRMILDILRFNREAPKLLESPNESVTLGDYLDAGQYSRQFREHYILPMGAAIWSSHPMQILKVPALFFVRFFHNHGMLSVDNRPVWRVIQGGSRGYLEPLTRRFSDRILLDAPVRSVSRFVESVIVRSENGGETVYDAVVLACHSDQALKLLADATGEEREILGAIPYQQNETVLHTDVSLLPRSRLAWAAWNYHIPREPLERVALTYNMNMLQSLDAPETFCVTLNRTEEIDPDKIIKRIVYHHPVYTPAGVRAQQRHGEISGVNRTYFCGAYWGFGFHEDGVNSALRVVAQIREKSDAA